MGTMMHIWIKWNVGKYHKKQSIILLWALVITHRPMTIYKNLLPTIYIYIYIYIYITFKSWYVVEVQRERDRYHRQHEVNCVISAVQGSNRLLPYNADLVVKADCRVLCQNCGRVCCWIDMSRRPVRRNVL